MDLTRLTQIATQTLEATLRRLPAEIRPLALAVPVHLDAFPADDVLEEGFEPDSLGLFSGNPHGLELATDLPQPAQIFLYLENLWAFAEGDPSVFREEVRLTYLHELGHYLGWDEDELAARGLD